MTGNAINAKSEALELPELSSEELDAVSGGSLCSFLSGFLASQQGGEGSGGQGGQLDPTQQFQKILTTLTQG
jgi:hypothetical protein